jgi:hypothetical protein
MAEGNGAAAAPISEARQQAVEAGLAQYQRTAHERDELQHVLAQARQEIAELRVMVEAHDGLTALMESRVASAVLERDHAVAERAQYEALHTAILAMCKAFKVPDVEPAPEGAPAAAG